MKYSWIFYFILLLVTVLIHIALGGSSNTIINSINFLLVVLVLLVSLVDFPVIVWFSFGGGLILDIYSNLPFGSFMLTLLATAVALEILFYNFFTNKSLYSLLILGFIGAVIYNLLIVSISSLVYFIGWSNFLIGFDYFWNFLRQIAANSIILFASFYLLDYLSKRFKLIFSH